MSNLNTSVTPNNQSLERLTIGPETSCIPALGQHLVIIILHSQTYMNMSYRSIFWYQCQLEMLDKDILCRMALTSSPSITKGICLQKIIYNFSLRGHKPLAHPNFKFHKMVCLITLAYIILKNIEVAFGFSNLRPFISWENFEWLDPLCTP